MTAFRKITLVPAAADGLPELIAAIEHDLLFAPDYEDMYPQEYDDPEYDPNEGCMSDNGYWDTDTTNPDSEDDLWCAAGCPTDADISEFFARQRCD